MSGLLVARFAALAAGALDLGLLAVLAIVVLPLLPGKGGAARDAGFAIGRRLLGWVVPLCWVALLLDFLSTAAWLWLQSASMSGLPAMEALSTGAVRTVLLHTSFGQATLLRVAGGILLALALLCLRSPERRRIALLGNAIAAVNFGAIAWTGHAAATSGAAGWAHRGADLLHLLAAGVWLGGLVGLWLVFAILRTLPRAGNAPAGISSLGIAVTRRFSVLGIVAVGSLVISGIVNSWFLVGDIPRLLGTAYGHRLTLKILVFGLMLGFAAYNRGVLTPRLGRARSEERHALLVIRRLQRNSGIEALLGLAVLGLVAIIGELPPARHAAIWWPFSWRFSGEALQLPDVAQEIALAAAAVVGGALLLLLGWRRRRTRLWGIPVALALILCFAPSFRLLTVTAYPTSFQPPAIPYDTASIARGLRLYPDYCAACHGARGKGDGPAAAGLPSPPADLTAAHVLAHPEGDLFWWITAGTGESGMPGFAASLDAHSRWDLVNLVRTLPAGGLEHGLGPEIGDQAPPAPDFAFDRVQEDHNQSSQGTLRNLLAKDAVLLIFFDDSAASRARLEQLERLASSLRDAGLTLLALPSAGASPDISLPGISFIAKAENSVAQSFALIAAAPGGIDGVPTAHHREFLIDRDDNIRAAWCLGDPDGWQDAAVLKQRLESLSAHRIAPINFAGHTH